MEFHSLEVLFFVFRAPRLDVRFCVSLLLAPACPLTGPPPITWAFSLLVHHTGGQWKADCIFLSLLPWLQHPAHLKPLLLCHLRSV